MAAAVQRIAIEAERHRFTFRQTRRTVHEILEVGDTSEWAPQLLRQAKPGEKFVNAFQDRPRPVPLETLGER
jgi:hypothetical protein